MENTSGKQTENYEQVRVALQREFIERCRRNSSYSLRAFAQYLEINQSFLSKILKSKRAITSNLAFSLAPKLGLKPSEVAALGQSGNTAANHLKLSDDEFDLISSWHHFAILELAKTTGFKFEDRFIATRLGLHGEEVRDALARLQRLGFIKIENNRLQVLTPNTTWTNNKVTTSARKHFQRTVLEKSIVALEHVPFEDRETGSVTVAINKARLPEFKEKMRIMRKEIADFLQADGETDLNEVYQLTISFFPLSKKISSNENNDEK